MGSHATDGKYATVPLVSPRGVGIWVMVLVMGLASACGGDSTDDTSPASTGNAVESEVLESDSTAADPTTAPSGEGEAPGSGESESGDDQPETLADYLGFDFDDQDAAQAFALENERRIQEFIARCMAEEGFEYIPAVRSAAVSTFGIGDGEDFARERGFGITTGFGEDNWFGSEDDAYVDPNSAIQESLSESARDAYFETLFGISDDSPAVDPETGEFTAEDIFGGGCSGTAAEEVYGQMFEVFQTLGPVFEELSQRMFADPRYLEASGNWSACMADRGYEYDSPDQMYTEVFGAFETRLEEIVGPGGGFPDPFEGWTEEEIETFLAESSDDEINDLFVQAQQAVSEDIDKEALAALQQEERDLAVAAFECQQDLDDTIEEIQREYESRLVSENREVLERLRT